MSVDPLVCADRLLGVVDAVVCVCPKKMLRPATVRYPIRWLDNGFAGALHVTLPLPTPLAGVTDSHAVTLNAVHAHPGDVVTVTCPDPPAPGTVTVNGSTVKLQPCAATLVHRSVPTMALPKSVSKSANRTLYCRTATAATTDVPTSAMR